MKNTYKKAIIVGASSGIGLATAMLLQKKGYLVTNISRSMPEDGMVETVLADASMTGSLRDAISEAAFGMDNDGRIDALIYSAGYSMASPIEYAHPEDYRYLFEVNFFGILESMQAALPYMKAKGGKIILISSLGGSLPIAFDAFYSASKAAVDMIAEAGDIELRPYNIRVCSVRPGGVRTDFTFKRNVYGAGAAGEYAEKQMDATRALAQIEQGGLEPEKVAGAVYAVLSAQNPPVKVVVGLKNKVFSAAAKILPDRMVGYFNSNKYHQ